MPNKSKTPRQTAAFRRSVNVELLKTRIRELDAAFGKLCVKISLPPASSESNDTIPDDHPLLLVERCYKLLGGLDHLASSL